MFTKQDLIDRQTTFAKMESLADELMNNRILKAGNKQYRLTEIEFYLFHRELFPDPTTHCDKRQLTSDHWYFHRFPGSEILRPLNRIGMDLTCGNQAEKIYGGILIRAIQDIDGKEEYIYGPSVLVNKLWSEMIPKPSKLEDLEEKDANTNSSLQLLPQKLPGQKIFECPRVGLGKKATEEFQLAPYRFITFASKKHVWKEKTIYPYLKGKYDLEVILKEFKRRNI
ncbi:MAG: hypothetical protein D4R64_05555 [Porphyromonadaceae bacterium]|nr:MAG: hypothetical protein D4R64_05555 [Porphyromonadaceae bacterium]